MNKSNSNNIKIIKKDFVAFLFVLWDALLLPNPTPCQMEIAQVLSNRLNTQFILQAFRGVGKSVITCAYVAWLLWNNPQLKVLIVSASKIHADHNCAFIKKIIDLLPFLHSLKPRANQKSSTLSFDVGLALPAREPSVRSVGITGQMTGSRADILIADDVEVPSNSATQGSRSKLWKLVEEFASIRKPDSSKEKESRSIYLGTPQTEMTLYKELEDNRGYSTIIWPALFPRSFTEESYYGSRLSPMLQKKILDNGLERVSGQPTDPSRFSLLDLRKRELEYGRAGFTLQFMLNTNLSDLEKYPLRLRDLIVTPCDLHKAPLYYQWLPNQTNCLDDNVPNVGLKGDAYYNYHSCSENTSEYQDKLLVIDPSGRGKDETGYVVLFTLNGYIYLMETGGFLEGYATTTLNKLAEIAKKWKVHKVLYEGNFGDGMFGNVFQPILQAHHPCIIEEIKTKSNKETRICNTLEPVMANHRLVIKDTVIQEDYQSAQTLDKTRLGLTVARQEVKYSLFYQMTRMSQSRGSIAHDDRLDALAMGVSYLKEVMQKDTKKGERDQINKWIEECLENPIVFTRRGIGEKVSVEITDDDEYSIGNYLDSYH